MARVELIFPEPIVYAESIDLRVTDMSRAGHLGFDKLVSLLQHVLARFFDHYGLPAGGGNSPSIIVKDLAVVYQGEAHTGDRLSFAVGVGERGERWIELYFRVTREDESSASDRPVSLAKMAVLCFDYAAGCTMPFPAAVMRALIHDGT
ncbi:MAG: thioesterase family protein [Desulfosarcinaceae bacterium]|nr:thioesterase family protein [Desulfosarcinaceae bacterium]